VATNCGFLIAERIHDGGFLLLSGRAPDIATLRTLFTTRRLTTVTGPPGSGKTTVATAAARRAADSFRDGMRIVPLGKLPDEALLAHAIMRTLGIPDRPSLPQAEALCDGLTDSRSLLILDGCGHLRRGCAALVRSLLRRCPRLHVGVTSIDPLGLDDERVFRLTLHD
jgi:predicted ATPase